MDRKFTSTAFLIWSGPLIWAADFLVIYVIAAIACAKGFAGAQIAGVDAILFTSLATSVAAAIPVVVVLRRSAGVARSQASDARVRFTAFVTAALAALALLAIVWTALPGVLLGTTCS